jgi:acetyl esterase/lipase
LPRGYALHRGYKFQRAVMQLMGNAGRLRNIPVAAVNEHVTVRLHRPAGLPDRAPAMLWIHGGGTLMGTAVQDDKYCRKLSHRTGVAVAAVEHRLAPEHPYPTPVEDCYAALLWLARQPWVDRDRIAVGGASAGGHFAAAVAQRAHDRKEVHLALQLLVYPMLDDRTGANRDGPRRIMWTERDNQLAWQWYLRGADPVAAAPARREDLSGLPRTWIGVGTLDLFYQECVEYGRRLREADVPVHQEIVPGAFHAFDQIADKAPISLNFFASQCDSLRDALAPTKP